MTDPTPSVWRRRLYVAGLVPLVVALLFLAKVVLMTWSDGTARSAYEDGRVSDALSEYESNGRVNVLEPWVARFGAGTTRVALGEFPEAVTDLEAALRDAPGEQECRVRVNLALALAGAGAEPGLSRADARATWRSGRTVLAEGECLTDPSTQDPATAVDRRLRELLRKARDEPDPEPTQEPEPEQPEETEEPEPEPEEPEETASGSYEW